jgi:hypothetical protein
MNSAPFAPNSSCATSQGSRSNGAPTRDGSGIVTAAAGAAAATASGASLPGSFANRRAVKYSGFSARQRACVCRLRSPWHASDEQTRCRSPWRVLGKYHRRQIRHGRLRFTPPSSPQLPWTAEHVLPAHPTPQLLGIVTPPGSILASSPGSFLASAEGLSSYSDPRRLVWYRFGVENALVTEAPGTASP